MEHWDKAIIIFIIFSYTILMIFLNRIDETTEELRKDLKKNTQKLDDFIFNFITKNSCNDRNEPKDELKKNHD